MELVENCLATWPSRESEEMAPNFEKILAPIQFNDPNSVVALDLARKLVSERRGRVFLLHVTPSTLVVPDLPGYRDLFPTDEHTVSKKLEKLAAAHLNDASYQVIVKTGEPAEIIKRVAQELEVDVTIMSTHGRRGLSHFFMGSVAERVIR